jgi:signal transduction histidine kinase
MSYSRPSFRCRVRTSTKCCAAPADGKVSWCTENVAGSGSSWSATKSFTTTRSGRPLHILEANADITERERTEAELSRSQEQLRALAARLHEVREEESIRIARELHDQLGRCLTTMKMDLSLSSKRNPQRSQPAS